MLVGVKRRKALGIGPLAYIVSSGIVVVFNGVALSFYFFVLRDNVKNIFLSLKLILKENKFGLKEARQTASLVLETRALSRSNAERIIICGLRWWFAKRHDSLVDRKNR